MAKHKTTDPLTADDVRPTKLYGGMIDKLKVIAEHDGVTIADLHLRLFGEQVDRLYRDILLAQRQRIDEQLREMSQTG